MHVSFPQSNVLIKPFKTMSLNVITLTAVCLVLSVAAVVLAVAAQVKRDALLFARALELARQADVRL